MGKGLMHVGVYPQYIIHIDLLCTAINCTAIAMCCVCAGAGLEKG